MNTLSRLELRKQGDAQLQERFTETYIADIKDRINSLDGAMEGALAIANELKRRLLSDYEECDAFEVVYWVERVQNLKLARRALDEIRITYDYNR